MNQLLKPSDVLISKKTKDIVCDPDFLCLIDNFFSEEVYQQLYDTFPVHNEFWRPTENGFIVRDKSEQVHAHLEQHPLWKSLIKSLRSEQFLTDLQRFTAQPLRKAIGFGGLRRWHDQDGGESSSYGRFLGNTFSRPIETRFNFVRSTKGQGFAPHTDAQTKLVTILFYFSKSEWDKDFSGQTRFYKGKTPALTEKWRTSKVSHIPEDKLEEFYDDTECYFSSEFRPNRMVMFVRSDTSYHEVLPLECPDGSVRKVMQLNIRKYSEQRVDDDY